MYKLLVVIPIALFALYGCSKSDEFDSGIKSSSAEIQGLLVSELDKAGIKYKIDNDGFIRYQERHKTIVEALEKHIIETEYQNPGCKFDNEKEALAFISFLNSKGIDALTVMIHHDNYISWQPNEDEKIRSLLPEFQGAYQSYIESVEANL